MTTRMELLLSERVYFNPIEIATDIASGNFKVPRNVHLNETEELAARLACWVADEAGQYVGTDTKDDRSLIALMAELVAIAMMVQHRATLAAANLKQGEESAT